MTAGVDDEGRVVISTYPTRAKVANLRRDPRTSVMVQSDEWDGPWVQLDGTAEVIDLPDAVEPLVDYFRSISGEHPDWDEYREAMRRAGQVPDPRHRRALGPDRDRRLPTRARRRE